MKVVRLKVIEKHPSLTPTKAIADARRAGLNEILILGEKPDGTLFARANMSPGDAMLFMERAKVWLLAGCPED